MFQKLNNSPTKTDNFPKKVPNRIDFAQELTQTSVFLLNKLSKISEIHGILEKSSILELTQGLLDKNSRVFFS